MTIPTDHKPGDVVNGHVLTEGGQWVPVGPAAQPPAKKKHTVRNVILGLLLLSVLVIGGCMALIGSAANEVGKAIEEDANKAGGTDNPMAIVEGESFEVDGFDYASGWKVTDDVLGDATVKALKVTNNRDDSDSAIVEIKFWKGNEVLALVDCATEPVDVGTTVTLDCYSTDKLPKSYDKITINDSF